MNVYMFIIIKQKSYKRKAHIQQSPPFDDNKHIFKILNMSDVFDRSICSPYLNAPSLHNTPPTYMHTNRNI